MKIEKSEIENKIILLYRLRSRWKLKSYKKKKVWQQKQIFLVSILFKKVREEKGGGLGVVIRAWPHIREKYPK